MNTDKWTVSEARAVFAQLTKIAEGMLDQAAASPDAQSAGTAGPQEVVDALDVIVDQLEQVQAAIPAEPTTQEPMAAESPEPSPEEEPKLAKLTAELKLAQEKLDRIELEKVAERFAELHDEPKVQQAKYDEVINSKEKPAYWIAKIEAIEQFKQNEGASSYKPAQTQTSWLKPRSKVAKQSGEGMMNL